MNYIDLINKFWSCHKENCFSTSEIALYFHLLDTANSLAWKNPFREGNQSICSSLGLSEPTLQRSRDRLIKAGILKCISGKVKREITQYELILGANNLYLNDTLNDTLSNTLSNTLSAEKAFDINKQNKTKQNRESKPEKKNLETEKKEKDFLVKFPFNGEFLKTWQEWIEFRNEIKKPYKSEKSIQSQLDKLSEFDEQTAICMIKQSIRNQWQGIFEVKTDFKKKDFHKINPETVKNPNRLNFKKT